MADQQSSALLDILLREHQDLEDRMSHLTGSAMDVLAAGRTLLSFARHEDQTLASLTSLMEPAVLHELRAEHKEISHDLDLLGWLVRTSPESPDVPALAESLARRMHTHVSRDGRLLARAAGLKGR